MVQSPPPSFFHVRPPVDSKACSHLLKKVCNHNHSEDYPDTSYLNRRRGVCGFSPDKCVVSCWHLLGLSVCAVGAKKINTATAVDA